MRFFRRHRTLSRRYELLNEVGAGGMGTVYRARDHRDGSFVAVKVLHPFLRNEPQYVARFRREAEIARTLSSDRLVKVVDIGEDSEAQFLVMEYVAGVSLAKLLETGPLPEDAVLRIALDVAEALAEAHAKGIVHRDVKPANILIEPNGRAKLADLGIARADVGTITRTGDLIGSMHYIAPETTRGTIETRSDLYSLGIVMYQALSGRPPFVGETLFDVIRQHLDSQPPLLGSRAAVSEGTARVVHSCLAKLPRARPSSAKELAVRLNDALAPLSESSAATTSGGAAMWNAAASNSSVVPSTARRVSSRRVQIVAALLITASVVAVVVVRTEWIAGEPNRARGDSSTLNGLSRVDPNDVPTPDLTLQVPITQQHMGAPATLTQSPVPVTPTITKAAASTVASAPLNLRIVGPSSCPTPPTACVTGLWGDERVYRAIQSAVRWGEASRTVYGGQALSITMNYTGQSVNLLSQSYDTDLSAKLLSASGFNGGLDVQLFCAAEGQGFAVWLSGYLTQVGLKPTISVLAAQSGIQQVVDNSRQYTFGILVN